MELWILINPMLRTFLYFSCFTSVGAILFLYHFKDLQSADGLCYLKTLTIKSSMVGIVISLGSFFSIAGSLGGDFLSALDISMLRLTLETKLGLATIIGLAGFCLIATASKFSGKFEGVIEFLGSLILLSSFLFVGHSTGKGPIVSLMLIIHIIGVAFWLGSLLPFKWLCSFSNADKLYSIAEKFGFLALRYIGLLLIAGISYACFLFTDLQQLFNTTYGNIFVAKLFSVCLILSLGALNKFRIVPMLISNPEQGRIRLGNSIRLEILIASGILILSSFLTTSFALPSFS